MGIDPPSAPSPCSGSHWVTTQYSAVHISSCGANWKMILRGTVAGLALLATTYSRDLRKVARTFLTERIPVLGGLLLLTVGAAYAYFIRPMMPPFATIDAPGQFYDGLRTYEKMPCQTWVGISRWVVWFGLLGWSLIVFRVMTRRARLHLIPLVLISIGFTVLYVWNQNAWPTHFWAIRRFMPVIIPAIVVFAMVGVSWLLQFLSRPGRRLATGLVGALLIGYTLFVGATMYVVAEGSEAGTQAGLQHSRRPYPTTTSDRFGWNIRGRPLLDAVVPSV